MARMLATWAVAMVGVEAWGGDWWRTAGFATIAILVVIARTELDGPRP